MSRGRVPRPAVVVLCALPFLVPAMLASGAFTLSDYVGYGTNQINHRNTDRYAVRDPAVQWLPEPRRSDPQRPDDLGLGAE